jgi:hypothetical protein
MMAPSRMNKASAPCLCASINLSLEFCFVLVRFCASFLICTGLKQKMHQIVRVV